MSDHEPEIRRAVAEGLAGAGAGVGAGVGANTGEHPDAETLAAYHARELPEADERRVQDHLLLCRECAALLLDLEGLGDPDFGRDVEIPAGTGEALWERLRQEIRKEPASPPAAGRYPLPGKAHNDYWQDEKVFVHSPPRRRAAPPPWMSALAAALLVAVLGLSAWVASLRRTVDELSRPEVNAPVMDLVPLGIGQRDEAAAPDAEVPSGARMFTLILSPARRGDFRDYEAEIAPAGGPVVWRARGLRPNDYGSFSLTVPRRALESGEHRIRLFGIGSGGEREPLGEYALRIAP